MQDIHRHLDEEKAYNYTRRDSALCVVSMACCVVAIYFLGLVSYIKRIIGCYGGMKECAAINDHVEKSVSGDDEFNKIGVYMQCEHQTSALY